MAQMFNLTQATKEIGISRAWLYRKFLGRYRPQLNELGQPMLSKAQCVAIKAEIAKNGKRKGKRAT